LEQYQFRDISTARKGILIPRDEIVELQLEGEPIQARKHILPFGLLPEHYGWFSRLRHKFFGKSEYEIEHEKLRQFLCDWSMDRL